jgi:8-oxo-dGTP pyrophosphatase MutT (NUDIX family)
MQLAFRLRSALLRLLRVKTRGVKVMIFNAAGEILLVRNSYGRSDLFLLPGGGVHRSETPEAAARREVREETGLELRQVAQVGEYFSAAEGRRDSIHLFSALAEGAPKADALEVSEACFFPPDRLPANVSAATLRRLAEYRGERDRDGRW